MHAFNHSHGMCYVCVSIGCGEIDIFDHYGVWNGVISLSLDGGFELAYRDRRSVPIGMEDLNYPIGMEDLN